MSSEDPPQLTCGVCGASFGTVETWENHIKTAHPVQKHVDRLGSTVDAAIRNMAAYYDVHGIIGQLEPTLPELMDALRAAHEVVPEEILLKGPFTPEQVYEEKKKWARSANTAVEDALQKKIIAQLVPTPNYGPAMIYYWDKPSYQAHLRKTQSIFYSEYDFGQEPFLQRYWQKTYQPFLPAYGDMISIYVREGYMEEKWVEIPPEFVEFMKELGYSEGWTKRLWGKHWVLPGVDHLYEMFHKKIITYDEMATMLKYHDFEPVWRDRLIRNAYTMIPRVDIRRAYVWGILGPEDLQTRYEKLGYSPEDATYMKDIAIRFGLSAYYSRLLTVASGAFRKGQLSGADFQAWMEVCGLPREAQDLLLSAETMARSAAVTEPGEEPRTLSASQICGAYTKGLLSLSAARERLLDMGYLEGDADLLLALATPKPAAEEPSTEIVSAASLLYRQGWMSPEEFQTWLRKARLTPEEIAVQKDAQDLRYWLDYASDLLALWKQMYAKDIITLDEFYMNLLRWGCQPDRAWAIVSLEETRKIPKPRLGA